MIIVLADWKNSDDVCSTLGSTFSSDILGIDMAIIFNRKNTWNDLV